MKHVENLVLSAVPLGSSLITGLASSINPVAVNPWLAAIVSCLAIVYYVIVIGFKLWENRKKKK